MSSLVMTGNLQKQLPMGHLRNPHPIHTPNTPFRGAKQSKESHSALRSFSIDIRHSLLGMIPRPRTMPSQQVVPMSPQTLAHRQLLLMLPRVGGRTGPQISRSPGPRAKRNHLLDYEDTDHDLHRPRRRYQMLAPSKRASLIRVRPRVR